MAQVHVMFEGNSHDLDQDDLDVGTLSTDHEIRAAAAEALDAPVAKLANFDVDRNEDTGDVTLRPKAVFGR